MAETAEYRVAVADTTGTAVEMTAGKPAQPSRDRSVVIDVGYPISPVGLQRQQAGPAAEATVKAEGCIHCFKRVRATMSRANSSRGGKPVMTAAFQAEATVKEATAKKKQLSSQDGDSDRTKQTVQVVVTR